MKYPIPLYRVLLWLGCAISIGYWVGNRYGYHEGRIDGWVAADSVISNPIADLINSGRLTVTTRPAEGG